MIPAQIIFLDALPLTAQGKVDYGGLRLPAQGQSGVRQDIVAPRTPEEKIIADIWSDLLEIDVSRIGVTDNFFELGGHSLLGTQLMSRINNIFQTEIPLRYLFETPTIDGLALAIARVKAEQMDAERTQQILAEIEGLSEEELDWILANEMPFDDEAS
jgi:acyl carrier protein